MRTVYVAVITFFFIAFIVDTDAFYFIPVIIFAGNVVYPETISFSYLFISGPNSSIALPIFPSTGAPFCRAR